MGRAETRMPAKRYNQKSALLLGAHRKMPPIVATQSHSGRDKGNIFTKRTLPELYENV